MRDAKRIASILNDLDESLGDAAELVSRGRAAFDHDLAVRLAFEALSNRVGEACKRLVQLDAASFSEEIWALAAKNRDKIVHHYALIDYDVLWGTVAQAFPQLRDLARTKRQR